MTIGDKFYRFEAIDETDMGAQFLIECTIVDINSVTVEQDEDGVITVTGKQAEPEINDDDDDDVPLTEAQFVPPAEIVMVPAAEPAASAPSFADLADRARAVNLDDPALLRDQMIADPPQLRRSAWD